MEPVILLIAITAIISSTYLKSKRMNMERERIRLGLGEAPSPRKKGLFGRKKEQFSQIVQNNSSSKNNKEMEEIKKRMENLETILLDGMESNMILREKELQDEIRNLSARLNKLEH